MACAIIHFEVYGEGSARLADFYLGVFGRDVAQNCGAGADRNGDCDRV